MPREWAAKLLPRFRMQETFVKRPTGHAARRRAHTRAKHVKRLEAKSQPITRRADYVFGGYAAIPEFQFANRMRREHLSSLSNPETRHAGANDECGNLSAPVFTRARAGKDRVEISDAGV